MPTTNYTFDELYGAGTASINLTAETPYTFNITNNSGSSYFVMETNVNQNGVFGSDSPKNTSGSYTSLTNISTNIIGDYIAGFALPQGTNSFIFTPSSNVDGSTLRFRGTGGIILGIDGGTPIITPYSFFFDSTTAFAQLSPGITLGGTYQQPFTVEGWFKANNPGINSGPVLLSTSQPSSNPTYAKALTINVATPTQIRVDSNGASTTPFDFAQTMLPDTWYYVAVSRDSSGFIQAWLGKEGDATASASTNGRYNCSVAASSWALTGISDIIGRFIPANRDSELDYISGVRVTNTNLYDTTGVTIEIPSQTFSLVSGTQFLLTPLPIGGLPVDVSGNQSIFISGGTSFVDEGPNIEVQ
jgi:hypothetical protein